MKEVMKILNLSEPTVRKLIVDGRIRKLETNGAVRITKDDLDKYLKGE